MPAGRPPKWKFPEDFETAIEDYFESCFGIVEVSKGEGENKVTETKEVQVRPFTVAGLAYWLGLTTEGLREYGEKPEFSALVKAAKTRIQACVEEGLLSGKPAVGFIFWLKNHAGYRDKQEVEHSGAMTLEQLVCGTGSNDARSE